MSQRERPLLFGEVLFDRFPDGNEVLGGAPFNVAWNLRGLGFDPLLVSAVGDDDLGRKVLAAMESTGLDRSGVQVDGSLGTGIVDVTLKDGEPTFEIVADRAWDRIRAEALPDLPDVALVYHGSLALRGETSRTALENLRERLRAPVLLDVNLRPPWWGRRQVLSLLSTAHVVKMNETELRELVPEGSDLEDRARELIERFGLDLACVTRGGAGAVAFSSTETVRVAPPEKGIPVLDTVGAGDAFAAVLIAGRLGGWSLERTLARAQDLACEVVGLRGAVTDDPGFYRRFRDEWRIS